MLMTKILVAICIIYSIIIANIGKHINCYYNIISWTQHVIGYDACLYRGTSLTIAYLGGHVAMPLLGTSKTDTLLKMGFQTYIFCSKCSKCRFRDPNFKKFLGGHTPDPPRIVSSLWHPPPPPLTKILATLLVTDSGVRAFACRLE